jgi:hypothetical protein
MHTLQRGSVELRSLYTGFAPRGRVASRLTSCEIRGQESALVPLPVIIIAFCSILICQGLQSWATALTLSHPWSLRVRPVSDSALCRSQSKKVRFSARGVVVSEWHWSISSLPTSFLPCSGPPSHRQRILSLAVNLCKLKWLKIESDHHYFCNIAKNMSLFMSSHEERGYKTLLKHYTYLFVFVFSGHNTVIIWLVPFVNNWVNYFAIIVFVYGFAWETHCMYP